mmetsp:Transcript_2185/g.6934  ORF Transcript_2185/g.6934 Transcript_2185/m.6934 type:complete len:82 (+) Transcript_2185:115-360(+)
MTGHSGKGCTWGEVCRLLLGGTVGRGLHHTSCVASKAALLKQYDWEPNDRERVPRASIGEYTESDYPAVAIPPHAKLLLPR